MFIFLTLSPQVQSGINTFERNLHSSCASSGCYHLPHNFMSCQPLYPPSVDTSPLSLSSSSPRPPGGFQSSYNEGFSKPTLPNLQGTKTKGQRPHLTVLMSSVHASKLTSCTSLSSPTSTQHAQLRLSTDSFLHSTCLP